MVLPLNWRIKHDREVRWQYVSAAAISLLLMASPANAGAAARGSSHGQPHAVVVIDPGHPSEVGRGAVGRHTSEISVAWQVAQTLKPMLERDGYRVILTKRTVNEFVRNRRRAEIANAAHAKLMLRLHCDSGPGSGFAIYYPDRAGRAEGATGPSAEVIARSHAAAQAIHQGMAAALAGRLRDSGLLTDRQTKVGRRRGALIGSVFSRVPTVLVEMVVLSNVHDESFIRSPPGLHAMAQALLEGVEATVPRT